jgi:hypothetical protein
VSDTLIPCGLVSNRIIIIIISTYPRSGFKVLPRGGALDQNHTLMLVGEVGLKSSFPKSDI